MSTLSDLLNSGPVSARQAADLADSKDIDLRYGTLAGYWAGTHGRPTARSLAKLAQVVPFTEKQLQEAAWGRSAPHGPYVPPQEAVLLDDRQRRAVDELIRSIVAAKGSRHGVEATPQPRTPGEAAESEKTQAADGRDQRQADHDLAARDTGGISEGEQTRRDMDQQGEAPDPEGPEDGA